MTYHVDSIGPGDVVSGLEPSELVEVQRLAPFGSKTLVEGVGVQSRRVIKRPLAEEELLALVKVRGRAHTFQGDAPSFLLDEDLFQKDEHVSDRVREQLASYDSSGEDFEGERPISRARNRFFLRRLKEEMVDWDNQSLFKPRHTKTVGYDLTPEEKILYEEVTRYVRSKRKEARAKKNRNVELTLMVMQRRLASSPASGSSRTPSRS